MAPLPKRFLTFPVLIDVAGMVAASSIPTKRTCFWSAPNTSFLKTAWKRTPQSCDSLLSTSR